MLSKSEKLDIIFGYSETTKIAMPISEVARIFTNQGHNDTLHLLRCLAVAKAEEYSDPAISLANDFEDLATKIEEIARRH